MITYKHLKGQLGPHVSGEKSVTKNEHFLKLCQEGQLGQRSKTKNSFTLAIGWHLLAKDYTFIGISYAIKGIVQALLLDLSRRSGSTLASNIFSLIFSFTLFTLSAKCGTPSVFMCGIGCVSIAGISSIGFAKL